MLASQRVQDFKHVSLPQLCQLYTNKRHSPTVILPCWFLARTDLEALFQQGARLADRGFPTIGLTAVPLPKTQRTLASED
jgi:hypothetical protein